MLFAYSSRATTIYDSFILMITTIDGIWGEGEEKKKAYEIFRIHFGSILCLVWRFYSVVLFLLSFPREFVRGKCNKRMKV
jgi:hypothetical protein